MKMFQLLLTLLSFLILPDLFAIDPPTGQVVSWGRVPADETVLTNILSIAAGDEYGLAINRKAAVIGWGFDYYGQVTGKKAIYPYNANGEVIFDGNVLGNVTAISAGRDHSIALRNDGTVIVWGDNRFGQTNVPTGLSNVVAVSAGWNYSLALKQDGTVIGWGSLTKIPLGLSNVMAIAAARSFSSDNAALKKDGTIVRWNNRSGVIDMPLGASNVTAIALGGNHGLALKNDGTVFGWGDNSKGQATGTLETQPPSNFSYGPVTIHGRILKDVAAIAAGNEFSVALKRDGTVVAWGGNRWHQTDVPAGLSNVVAIAAGNDFCLAITTNSAITEKLHQKTTPIQ